MAVFLTWLLLAIAALSASTVIPGDAEDALLASCPGYKASNVQTTASSLTADLSLAGAACNAYGTDLTDLRLSVVYETSKYAYLGDLSKTNTLNR
jgi:alpha-glucosidase